MNFFKRLEIMIRTAVLFICKHYKWILLLFFGVLTAAIYYVSKNFEVITDLSVLLPKKTPSVVTLEEIKKRKGSTDEIELALVTSDIEKTKPFLPILSREISQLKEIDFVYYKREIDFFKDNQLLIFPSLDDLNKLYQKVSDYIKEEIRRKIRSGIGVDEARDKLRKEIDDEAKEQERKFDEKVSEYFIGDTKEVISLFIAPKFGSDQLKRSEELLAVLKSLCDKTLEKYRKKYFNGVNITIELWGGYRSRVEELKSTTKDIFSSALFTIILLLIIIFGRFRTIRSIFQVFLPLSFGVIVTLVITFATIGYLNFITAFIFAILLGLGIDYQVYILDRYLEEKKKGLSLEEAFVRAENNTGVAVIVGSTTTAAAFLVLIIADFKGFSHFGFIAAIGVTICLLSALFILPAITKFFEVQRPEIHIKKNIFLIELKDKKRRFPFAFPITLLSLVLALFSLGLLIYHGLTDELFEYDFTKLTAKHPHLEKLENQVRGTKGHGSSSNIILCNNYEEVKEVHNYFKRLKDDPKRHLEARHINTASTIYNIIPLDQNKRIEVLQKTARLIKRKLNIFEGAKKKRARDLIQRLDRKPLKPEDLPGLLKRQFAEKDGKIGLFVAVFPKGSMYEGKRAMEFAKYFRHIDISSGRKVLAGTVVVFADTLDVMLRDGPIVILLAFLMIILIQYLDFRSFLSVFITTYPLLIGMLWTIGLMFLLGNKFNFFNVVFIPTLVGIGIDAGVHVFHRYTEEGRGTTLYSALVMLPSVFIASATTLIGFSGTMFAVNPGLKSIAVISILGISACFITSVVTLPALLQVLEDSKVKLRSKLATDRLEKEDNSV